MSKPRTGGNVVLYISKLSLSERPYPRTRSVELTRISADVAGSDEIQSAHLAEALHLRQAEIDNGLIVYGSNFERRNLYRVRDGEINADYSPHWFRYGDFCRYSCRQKSACTIRRRAKIMMKYRRLNRKETTELTFSSTYSSNQFCAGSPTSSCCLFI